MSSLESRINHTIQTTRNISRIGMILGGSLAGIFMIFPGLGVWKGLYAGIVVWVAFYYLAVQVSSRSKGRFRPFLAWFLGMISFFVTFIYYQDFLSVLVYPASLAYLVMRSVNGIAHILSPYAHFEDQVLDCLASNAVQSNPDNASDQIRGLITRNQTMLTRVMKADLSWLESHPDSNISKRRCQHIIDLLTLVEDLPEEFIKILGQAYLGLARYQAATGDNALLRTLKILREYPLPSSGVAFLAEYYAEQGATDQHAVNAYLSFIRAHSSKPIPQSSVYAAALKTCDINPDDSMERLIEVESYARDYHNADPRLGWASMRVGQSLLWQGHPLRALEFLEICIQTQPDNADVHYYLGVAHQALGHARIAEDAYRTALSLAPAHLESAFSLGELLVARGRVEKLPDEQRQQVLSEARMYLSTVIGRQQNHARAHYSLGLVNYAEKNFDAARDHFKKAITLNGSIAEWHYQYARTLIELEDFNTAIEAVQQAVDLDAEYKPALRLLSNELLRSRQWVEAEASFRALATMGESDLEIATGLGRALFEQARYAEAIVALKSSTEPNRDRLFYLGWAYVRLKDYSAGIQAYQRAISKTSPDAELYFRLGCALAHAKKFPDALEALHKSLELEKTPQTYIQIGFAQIAMGEFTIAQEVIQSSLDLEVSVDGWYAQAICYERMGNSQKAKQALEDAFQLDKEHIPSLLASGILLEADGDFFNARNIYKRIADIPVEDPMTQLFIGSYANRCGLHTEAILHLISAQEAGIQSDQLYYQLGLAHAEKAHWGEAISTWSVLLDRHPEDEDLHRALNKCRYARGRQRFNNGDYSGAIHDWVASLPYLDARNELRQAIVEAAFREASGLLNTMYLNEDSINKARTNLEIAKKYSNHEEERLQWLESLILLAESDFLSAIKVLRRLHQASSDKPHLAYHLGFALFQSGQPNEAVPYLERALEASIPAPQRQAASLMLASYSTATSQWDHAAQMYRVAYETESESARG